MARKGKRNVTVNFDNASRVDFITGFSKRKAERQAAAKAKIAAKAEKDRKDLKSANRARTNEIMASYERMKASMQVQPTGMLLWEPASQPIPTPHYSSRSPQLPLLPITPHTS